MKASNYESISIYQASYTASLQMLENGDLTSAQHLLLPLVCEANAHLHESANKPKLEFNDRFQEKLYQTRYQQDKDIQPDTISYTSIFYHYGLVLSRMGQYNEATQAFNKAKVFNPVEAKIDLALADIAYKQEDYAHFLSYSKSAFTLSYHPEDVAQCHENFAIYFFHEGNNELALACCEMSLSFAHKPATLALQNKLQQKLNHPNAYTLSELKHLCTSHDIPLMVNHTIISLAIFMDKLYSQDTSNPLFAYYHNIYTNLASTPKH